MPSAKPGELASSLFQTVALSLLRKASLSEEMKHSVNFQIVEPMPVHTTLSTSFLQVGVWLVSQISEHSLMKHRIAISLQPFWFI